MNDAETPTDEQTTKKAEDKKSLWPSLVFIYSPFLVLLFVKHGPYTTPMAVLVLSGISALFTLFCLIAYLIFKISSVRAIVCSLPVFFIFYISGSMVSPRDRLYCTYAEQDAGRTLVALDSYFLKNGSTAIPTVAVLRTEENLTLNNADDFISINPAPGTAVSSATIIQVTVTDESGRCYRGNNYTLTTSEDKGVWKK